MSLKSYQNESFVNNLVMLDFSAFLFNKFCLKNLFFIGPSFLHIPKIIKSMNKQIQILYVSVPIQWFSHIVISITNEVLNLFMKFEYKC